MLFVTKTAVCADFCASIAALWHCRRESIHSRRAPAAHVSSSELPIPISDFGIRLRHPGVYFWQNRTFQRALQNPVQPNLTPLPPTTSVPPHPPPSHVQEFQPAGPRRFQHGRLGNDERTVRTRGPGGTPVPLLYPCTRIRTLFNSSSVAPAEATRDEPDNIDVADWPEPTWPLAVGLSSIVAMEPTTFSARRWS